MIAFGESSVRNSILEGQKLSGPRDRFESLAAGVALSELLRMTRRCQSGQ